MKKITSLYKLLLKKYRTQLILSGSVFLIFGITTYVLIPRFQAILDTQTEINFKQDELVRIQKKRSLLDSMDRSSIGKQLEEVIASLPNDKDTASILISLENISANTGIAIESIGFSPGLVSTEAAATAGETKYGVDIIPVRIEVRGNVGQFTAFLHQLLESKRLFDIDNLSVSGFADRPDSVNAILFLVAYYLPSITEIGAVESPIQELSDDERKTLTTLAKYPYLSRLEVGAVTTTQVPIGKSNLFSY